MLEWDPETGLCKAVGVDWTLGWGTWTPSAPGRNHIVDLKKHSHRRPSPLAVGWAPRISRWRCWDASGESADTPNVRGGGWVHPIAWHEASILRLVTWMAAAGAVGVAGAGVTGLWVTALLHWKSSCLPLLRASWRERASGGLRASPSRTRANSSMDLPWNLQTGTYVQNHLWWWQKEKLQGGVEVCEMGPDRQAEAWRVKAVKAMGDDGGGGAAKHGPGPKFSAWRGMVVPRPGWRHWKWSVEEGWKISLRDRTDTMHSQNVSILCFRDVEELWSDFRKEDQGS